MKRVLLFVMAIACCASNWATPEPKRTVHGSGRTVSEVRAMSNVHEISVVTGIKCRIEQGSRPQVRVEADDNVIEHILTEQHGDELVIRVAPNVQLRSSHVSVRVTMPDFKEVNANAGSTVEVGDWNTVEASVECGSGATLKCSNINAQEVEASVSSGGKLTAKVDCQELDASASSGSTMKIIGSSQKAEIEASSGASLRAILDYKRLEAEASSGGSVLYVDKENATLKVHTSSGGSVRSIPYKEKDNNIK